MIGEGIFAQDDEEEGAPAIVVVGGAVEDHRHKNLDAEDGDGGGVDVGMLGLIGIEGRGAISCRLAAGLLGIAFALLALLTGLALGVGFGHCEGADDVDNRTLGVDEQHLQV
jgi:hypothetical protein